MLDQTDFAVTGGRPPSGMSQADEELTFEIDWKALLTPLAARSGAVVAEADVKQFDRGLALVFKLDELPQHRLLGGPVIRHRGCHPLVCALQAENGFAIRTFARLQVDNVPARRFENTAEWPQRDFQFSSSTEIDRVASSLVRPHARPQTVIGLQVERE